jgi:hypothetical protein
MRSDGPLIGAIIFLGAGLGLIIGYCHGTTGFSAAYPFSGSVLHLDMTTTGPGVLGGLALAVIGAFLLLWAILAALVSLLTSSAEPRERASERYSIVPAYEPESAADRYSVVPRFEETPQPDAPEGADQHAQHAPEGSFWSSPSAGSQI